MNSPDSPSELSADELLARRLEEQARQRARSRREKVGNLWQQVARVGTLGWMIVLPIVGGALAGHLLDRHFGTGVRWALALMSVGVMAGGFALWRAIQEGADKRG